MVGFLGMRIVICQYLEIHLTGTQGKADLRQLSAEDNLQTTRLIEKTGQTQSDLRLVL